MSQAKVDRYKKEKANRKKLEKQKKMKSAFAKTIVGLCVLAVVVWIGYSAYDNYESSKPAAVTYINLDSLNNYMYSLD
jgi:hypothetical protein